MQRESNTVSVVVRRRDHHVVMRLNKSNYTMSATEAVRLADQLVDAAETKETE